jgi:tetratricopeptide (TPR) repeat protein
MVVMSSPQSPHVACPVSSQRGAWALLMLVPSQIGEAYQELGKQEEAISHLQQARVIRHALGERWGEARTLYTLGESLCQVGHGNAARESWEHALAIFEDLKSPLAREVRARLEAPTCPLPQGHQIADVADTSAT